LQQTAAAMLVSARYSVTPAAAAAELYRSAASNLMYAVCLKHFVLTALMRKEAFHG
jgi:hypothetical protein